MRFPMFLAALTSVLAAGAEPLEVSGIYPSLSYYSDEGECGTGAVCPWAGSLWVVTYGPHCPVGSSDKLYQITPDLKEIIREESVGGTHADRLIHRESQQLFIGTYLVDREGRVRTVPIHTMPGRLTGAARHLSDPKNKIYVTDMEEALYELDVNTLETVTRIRDGHNVSHFTKLFKRLGVEPPKGWKEAEVSDLFGYHGKGTCSGFGRVFYGNNGWYNERAMVDPTIPSGALAWWSEEYPRNWHMIRASQFTDITTKDGVYGNEHPYENPIWAMGWDAKSVILSVTTNGVDWTDYRIPKGSHSYDGAHGWNTEWPRIREIGRRDGEFLATMHGTFWRFPSEFRPGNAKGIRPRSNYLKVIGDFCEWNGRLVFGCDDSARDEFLNKRSVKGAIKGPAKSHSNLWFVDEPRLDRLGPAIGNALVWNREDVAQGRTSAPYLFAGYDLKWAWVTEGEYTVEVDENGTDEWKPVGEIAAGGNDLSAYRGEWVRFTAKRALRGATLALVMRNADARVAPEALPGRSVKLAAGEKALLHVNAIDPKALSMSVDGRKGYHLDAELKLSDFPEAAAAVPAAAPLVTGVLRYEPASILYVDDAGNRWRLPYGDEKRQMENGKREEGRVCREVCTERDHFNAGGLYYELPAENAHGFAGLRAVTTHNLPVYDYASWRGLFALSLPGEVRLMAIDDVWGLGKAKGFGGPWRNAAVRAGERSDAYLLNGFDVKKLSLEADRDAVVTMEVDITGWGVWAKAGEYRLRPGVTLAETLPRAFGGYWARFTCDRDASVTALFTYE